MRSATFLMTLMALLSLMCAEVLAQSTQQIDLVPLAEEYGVGQVKLRSTGSEQYVYKADGDLVATYGHFRVEMFFESSRVWAIYDVSGFPSSIDVKELTINSYLYYSGVEGEVHETYYFRLTQDPRTLDADSCWSALNNYQVYEMFVTPNADGEMSTVLGDLANQDFEDAVNGSGLFMIGIDGDGWCSPFDCLGSEDEDVDIKGWTLGYPRLTVAFAESTMTPVMPTTWGRIKGQYGP